MCCGCCCGDKSKCRCCCCGKRGAAITFGLLGLLLAASIIAFPVYLYKTDQDYNKMFPVLTFGKNYLAKLADGNEHKTIYNTDPKLIKDDDKDDDPKIVSDEEENNEIDDHKKIYKLAIFQLLNDIEAKTDCLAFTSFCLGCVNVPLYLFLLIGTIFRKSCPILFWLIFALLELLLIGIPMIIFIGIISLYLACQLHLYVLAGTLIGIVMVCFICTFSSWITVYKCYYQFKEDNGYDAGYRNSSDGQLTQPLLSSGPGPAPPPLPPNHPSAGTSYQLGQYPQYYPPHGNNSSRALPSAPPHGGIYPSLANA